MCEQWKNGQQYTLKVIHSENTALYRTLKEKMRIELENLFLVAEVKNFATNKGIIMDWLGLIIATHGHWLTFEKWVLFINNLKLGMVAGESVEFYEKLNLPKLAGWLNLHNDWLNIEIAKESEKMVIEKETEWNKQYDERRKRLNYFIKLFHDDPSSKLLTEQLIKEIKTELAFREEMAQFFEANKHYFVEQKTVRDFINFKHAKQEEIKGLMQKISDETDETIKANLTQILNNLLGINQNFVENLK